MIEVKKTLELEIVECITCGVIFAIPAQLDKQNQKEHKDFYCPNGHAEHYAGKSKQKQLEEEVHRLKGIIQGRDIYSEKLEDDNTRLIDQVKRLKKKAKKED